MSVPNADENTSQPAKHPAQPSQQIKSTPAKPRTVSSTFEHNSVDGDFRVELEQFQYSGITFEDFLMQSFTLSDNEMKNLKERVQQYAVHSTSEYQEQAEIFRAAAEKEERSMYVPYAEMGNMIIDRALQDSQTPKNEVKLLPFDKQLAGDYAKRKPDVLLVPKKDGEEEITKDNLRWQHVLWVLEFKKAHQPSSTMVIGKRPRETDQEAQPQQKKKTRRSKPLIERLPEPLPASAPGRLFAGEVECNASPDATHTRTPVADDPFAEGIPTTSGTQEPSNSLQERKIYTVATPEDGRKAILDRSGALEPIAFGAKSDAQNTRAPPEIQLANYLTEVMSARGDRSYVFGAIVTRTKMKLQYFSRSCGIISDEIDIIEDPILFAVFLVLITLQTHEKLGFNTKLGYCNPFDTKSQATMRLEQPLEGIDGGDSYKFDPTCDIVLNNLLHAEYCLVGRGTAVYEIEKPQGCEVDLVLKASWQVKTRRHEDEAILIAREVDPKHTPEIYGKLTIPDTSPTQALLSACNQLPLRRSEERELRILLMRKYKPARELSDEKFTVVMGQMIYFIHALYSEKSLLHRDIGINNIAYIIDKNGKLIGILLDYDLATFPLPDHDGQPTSDHRSGTKPFMAIETLDTGSGEYKHHLVHDLESILYTLVWQGVGYRGSVRPQRKVNGKAMLIDPLWNWRSGTWEEVCVAKKTFLGEKTDTILPMISYTLLRDICDKLCTLFEERYSAIAARRRWESAIKKHKAGQPRALAARLQAIGFEMAETELLPEEAPPIEPPLPSNSILPMVLKQIGMKKVACTKDCCQAFTLDCKVVSSVG